MEHDVPACGIDASIADAMHALDAYRGWERCVVVNDANVVLGVLDRTTATTRPMVEAVRFGPSTVRPDAELEETREHMREHGTRERVVTDPTGRLLGVLRLPIE
jgi:CBS domain-containing protein